MTIPYIIPDTGNGDAPTVFYTIGSYSPGFGTPVIPSGADLPSSIPGSRGAKIWSTTPVIPQTNLGSFVAQDAAILAFVTQFNTGLSVIYAPFNGSPLKLHYSGGAGGRTDVGTTAWIQCEMNYTDGSGAFGITTTLYRFWVPFTR
jgi:hypothetical protein